MFSFTRKEKELETWNASFGYFGKQAVNGPAIRAVGRWEEEHLLLEKARTHDGRLFGSTLHSVSTFCVTPFWRENRTTYKGDKAIYGKGTVADASLPRRMAQTSGDARLDARQGAENKEDCRQR